MYFEWFHIAIMVIFAAVVVVMDDAIVHRKT